MRDILGISGAALCGLLALMFEPYSLWWWLAVSLAAIIFLWSAGHLLYTHLNSLIYDKRRQMGGYCLIAAGMCATFALVFGVFGVVLFRSSSPVAERTTPHHQVARPVEIIFDGSPKYILINDDATSIDYRIDIHNGRDIMASNLQVLLTDIRPPPSSIKLAELPLRVPPVEAKWYIERIPLGGSRRKIDIPDIGISGNDSHRFHLFSALKRSGHYIINGIDTRYGASLELHPNEQWEFFYKVTASTISTPLIFRAEMRMEGDDIRVSVIP